ncbi:MAG: 4Fe-4S dicluster domain-containing protein [Gammaproteobacteria bacterium]|nr:4Fe-4S dicluster domain-containing protein [Gammaproteobacteria bacterium]NNM00934.1 4Fe-4S dicluster domain-containing protein [Gammaproteobacteria bacterium]
MKLSVPDPDPPFAYRSPPPSGNTINGLGETRPRQAVQIFHGSGSRRLEWELAELFFLLTMPLRLFLRGLCSRWILRNADGPVAAVREASGDAAVNTAHIKQRARELGAGAVGICTLNGQHYYDGVTPRYRTAISIAYPMDFDAMMHVTDLRGGLETMRAYIEITKIVVALARDIRARGWGAVAYCESADILHLPIAIDAGLGELGKHGSLINREIGSNLRLATVLTEMPLESDAPVDIAADDLCLGCQRCTIDCPVDAISDSKQMVRGIEKWYVDFDRCLPYFVKTYGCGICIQVCPWTKPGRGPGLSAKLLARRQHRDGA